MYTRFLGLSTGANYNSEGQKKYLIWPWQHIGATTLLQSTSVLTTDRFMSLIKLFEPKTILDHFSQVVISNEQYFFNQFTLPNIPP